MSNGGIPGFGSPLYSQEPVILRTGFSQEVVFGFLKYCPPRDWPLWQVPSIHCGCTPAAKGDSGTWISPSTPQPTCSRKDFWTYFLRLCTFRSVPSGRDSWHRKHLNVGWNQTSLEMGGKRQGSKEVPWRHYLSYLCHILSTCYLCAAWWYLIVVETAP